MCCLRYCKSTIFQANHNYHLVISLSFLLFAILQKYDFSSKSQLISSRSLVSTCCLRYCKSTIFQANHNGCAIPLLPNRVVCDTAKVRFFKQITTLSCRLFQTRVLFAILQKYDFSSKSQLYLPFANKVLVVCDTAKVRFFKQITTTLLPSTAPKRLFAILQKYDFSSKSQLERSTSFLYLGCLRYCKSTIFQANHNTFWLYFYVFIVVCDTAKVRFFKQITTGRKSYNADKPLFAILQKYDFSSKSQLGCTE